MARTTKAISLFTVRGGISEADIGNPVDGSMTVPAPTELLPKSAPPDERPPWAPRRPPNSVSGRDFVVTEEPDGAGERVLWD